VAVRQVFEAALVARGYRSDAAQLRAMRALERCENEWIAYKARRGNAVTKLLVRPPIPRGVYMWGGVGRGKSFLMDCFFRSVPLTRKTRLHFHEFMREVHRELQELRRIRSAEFRELLEREYTPRERQALCGPSGYNSAGSLTAPSSPIQPLGNAHGSLARSRSPRSIGLERPEPVHRLG
jgi:predicted ATPase